MTAWSAWRGGRRAAAALLLALAGEIVACASPPPPAPPSSADLLRGFEEGRVRLDCVRCRYDFIGADWLLETGDYEALVLGILRSGDGSGRSWYLLGRVAEETSHRDLALAYYRESLATARNPILPIWPLYEDVNYRIRRLATNSAPRPERPSRTRVEQIETVDVDALVVASRPGSVGAFVEKLHRGDPVDVLDRSGDWEQVRLADGRVGWVWGSYTSAPRDAAAEPRKSKPAPAKRAARVAPKRAPARTAKAPVAEAPAASPPVAQVPAVQPAPPAPTVATAVAKAPAPEARPAPAPEPGKAAPASSLPAAPVAGILGCPLPRGASLSIRSHGAAGADDHPTETYAIQAPAHEIVGFYEREMERAGWRKSFAASEYLLYFEKDDRTVGILVERKGGLFTLMGS
jgi:hypothetical protein